MSSLCKEIHILMNSLPRFTYPFDFGKLPRNGLLILFEKGESCHGKDRIVMIGSHTQDNRLRERLEEHFIIENHDRSILRKHIGRCILNKKNDQYAAVWEINMIPLHNREEYGHLINEEHQQCIEKEISNYMRENLSFCVIRVDNNDERKKLKFKLVASISNCEECMPSNNWLGLYSPIINIRESGLWQVQGLNGQPLTIEEMTYIKTICNTNM